MRGRNLKAREEPIALVRGKTQPTLLDSSRWQAAQTRQIRTPRVKSEVITTVRVETGRTDLTILEIRVKKEMKADDVTRSGRIPAGWASLLQAFEVPTEVAQERSTREVEEAKEKEESITNVVSFSHRCISH